MLNINSPKPLVVSLINYGVILYLFVGALLAPEQNINFIYNVGVFIFLTEFLSMHSSGMLSGHQRLSQKVLLLGVYLIFVVAWSFATQTFYPAVIFALSLVAKAFDKTPDRASVATSFFMILGTVVVTVLLSPLIVFAFEFPQSVLNQAPANSSGMFVEQPQTLLVWGILYYAGMIFLQIRAHRKTIKLRT